MTNHPKFTASHDSAARSVGYEGAGESRKSQVLWLGVNQHAGTRKYSLRTSREDAASGCTAKPLTAGCRNAATKVQQPESSKRGKVSVFRKRDAMTKPSYEELEIAFNRVNDECERVYEKLEGANEELAHVRELLQRHGTHDYGCPLGESCSCGLWAALNAGAESADIGKVDSVDKSDG